jgi:galactokinase
MAVCVDVIIAVRAVPVSQNNAAISINNTDEAKFPGQVIRLDRGKDITIDATKHLWTNYLMAGLIGAVKLLDKTVPNFQLNQMEVLVDGNIPPGGGLSSSAAFVCASALAVMQAHEYRATQTELLELAIVSERLVGVHSGGLVEQAIRNLVSLLTFAEWIKQRQSFRSPEPHCMCLSIPQHRSNTLNFPQTNHR